MWHMIDYMDGLCKQGSVKSISKAGKFTKRQNISLYNMTQQHELL